MQLFKVICGGGACTEMIHEQFNFQFGLKNSFQTFNQANQGEGHILHSEGLVIHSNKVSFHMSNVISKGNNVGFGFSLLMLLWLKLLVTRGNLWLGEGGFCLGLLLGEGDFILGLLLEVEGRGGD